MTGSHAFKGGFELSHGKSVLQRNFQNPNVNFYQRYHNVNGVSVPFQVTLFNTPTDEHDQLNADLGLYVQDTWTRKRLTLTPGLRWEYFNASYPEEGVSVQQQALMIAEGYTAAAALPGADHADVQATSRRASARRTICSATARRRSRQAWPSTTPRFRR